MLKITPEIREAYQERVLQYLTQGIFTDTVKTTTSRKYLRNADNELIGSELSRKTDKTVQRKPCPDWIMKLVADAESIECAIDLLLNNGYEVSIAKPEIVKDLYAYYYPETSEKPEEITTLSEETINDIKSRILGID